MRVCGTVQGAIEAHTPLAPDSGVEPWPLRLYVKLYEILYGTYTEPIRNLYVILYVGYTRLYERLYVRSCEHDPST